jgi:hypothetical protein
MDTRNNKADAGHPSQHTDSDAGSYCRRLACILQNPDKLAGFRAALTTKEQKEVFDLNSPTPLLDLLLQSPRLQSIAASCTSYTPSVWLLEQELHARGRAASICALATPPCTHSPGADTCCADANAVYAAARTVYATGMCFSGGGIRSATFNLGILQGLARLELLGKFDYLSTVSGGGYIHQFLAAWIKNAPLKFDPSATPPSAIAHVEEQLNPLPQTKPSSQENLTEHPEPIRWLRRYSNYLTPRTGLFSTDTWVMIAIWLRNTFLNQLALISLLATLLCLPHFLTTMGSTWNLLRPLYVGVFFVPYSAPCLLIGLIGLLAIGWIVSVIQTAKKPVSESPSRLAETFSNTQWKTVLVFLFAIAFLVAPALYRSTFATAVAQPLPTHPVCTLPACNDKPTARISASIPPLAARCQLCAAGNTGIASLKSWFANNSYPHWLNRADPGFWVEMIFLGFVGIFCFAVGITSIVSDDGEVDTLPTPFGIGCSVVAAAVAVATAGLALYGIRISFFALFFVAPYRLFESIAVVFLPIAVLSVIFLSLVITAGIMGRLSDDALREAMARLRALAFFVSLVWLTFTGFALLGPPMLLRLLAIAYLRHAIWLGWIGTTVGSVLAGRSAKTADSNTDTNSGLQLLIVIGPPTFVIGLLLLIATVLQFGITAFCLDTAFLPLLGLTACLLATALLFGIRLDINDFSMHAFYRDRLARCYAGASYPRRRPDRFTGFARTDSEIRVADLLPVAFTKGEVQGKKAEASKVPYSGPFPIFCTSVNLTFGQDLAWQERKAASFAFTPLYSGYSVGWTSEYVLTNRPKYTYNGFARTKDYAYEGGGIPLHSAVAISGAAVSPNWGYHTEPAMAFLLTMFNVRLGWWIKNPRLIKTTCPPSPPFPLYNLTSELMGRATDASSYVYLTDGGHFDNMGLYELVRRRCRRILICDAEQDGDNTFEGIGMSIRKCRVDFGVEIDLDLRQLDPHVIDPSRVPPTPLAPSHFVKGTIRYPEDGPTDKAGDILYIKASLTGDEPGDILNYKRQHDEFPHESTADQWFSESQFESYRRLGYHIVLDSQQWLSQQHSQTHQVTHTATGNFLRDLLKTL